MIVLKKNKNFTLTEPNLVINHKKELNTPINTETYFDIPQ